MNIHFIYLPEHLYNNHWIFIVHFLIHNKIIFLLKPFIVILRTFIGIQYIMLFIDYS